MPGHSVMTVTASIMPLAPAHSTRMMDASTAAGYPSPAASQYTHGQRKTTAAVEETDESLALKTADGDASAFREIVRRHGGRLRAIVFRFSGSGSDADDIVQDAFVRYWRTAKRWKPGGPPLGAYLTRIAINRAIDMERRRKVRRFFGLDEAAEIPDARPLQDEQSEARERIAAVSRDIALLPPRQRAAILLAADGNTTNADIAAAMEISEGAAEQLLVRARRTLRTKLAEREMTGGDQGR